MRKPDIRAAGAVVLRRHANRQEALVVHRPRYDDWSLPKGKLEAKETTATCAVREVREETGIRVRLVQPLSAHNYKVKSKTKQVDWWRAEVVDTDGTVADRTEVDELLWLPVKEAAKRLSYDDERDRLREAVDQRPVTPLLVLRHAKALPRKNWSGKDSERPITDWGHRQTRALVPFLAAFGVRRVVSSSATRCLQTVSPFALRSGLSLEGWHTLTEERFEIEPDDARQVMTALAREAGASGVPTVVCGHRPVFPAMLQGLSLPDYKFATAEALVVALREDGTVATTQPIRQRLSR